jgi:hypothetical protein
MYPAEADFSMTQMAMEESQRGGFDQDSKLFVTFSLKPHPDKEKTKAEGRPIYSPREYVTIMVPGDKLNVISRPVSDIDRRRFAPKYAAFQAGQAQAESGTPLESVPWISREQVEELKYFNVRSLENLANLADVHAQRFMGINALRQKARDHIQLAKEQAPALRLTAELRQRDEKIAQQDKLLAELAAKVEALTPKAAAK